MVKISVVSRDVWDAMAILRDSSRNLKDIACRSSNEDDKSKIDAASDVLDDERRKLGLTLEEIGFRNKGVTR